jgi:hypothetical protein
MRKGVIDVILNNSSRLTNSMEQKETQPVITDLLGAPYNSALVRTALESRPSMIARQNRPSIYRHGIIDRIGVSEYPILSIPDAPAQNKTKE